MQNATRLKFNQYAADQAALNAVASAAHLFNVAPNVEQRIVDQTQASSAFLALINMVLVDAQKGSSLGLSAAPNASTTDTRSGGRRTAKGIINSNAIDDYFCQQTDFDVGIPYALIDAWAHRPEFQKILSARLVQQMAIDKLTIGFHGISRADTSDRAANPLGQDVNIGWLQKIRNKTDRYMDGIVYGADHEYKNIDAVVMDAVSSLLDPWHRNSEGIVAICNSTTAMRKYFDITNRVQSSVETEASQRLQSERHFGMKNLMIVDQMPDDAILITSADNMSIYTQRGSTRKSIADEPKANQVEILQSQNDAYVLEDFGRAALIELQPVTDPAA